MTAPMVATLDRGSSFLSLMDAMLIEAGYILILAADRGHGGRGVSRPVPVDERAQMDGWAIVGMGRTDALW